MPCPSRRPGRRTVALPLPGTTLRGPREHRTVSPPLLCASLLWRAQHHALARRHVAGVSAVSRTPYEKLGNNDDPTAASKTYDESARATWRHSIVGSRPKPGRMANDSHVRARPRSRATKRGLATTQRSGARLRESLARRPTRSSFQSRSARTRRRRGSDPHPRVACRALRPRAVRSSQRNVLLARRPDALHVLRTARLGVLSSLPRAWSRDSTRTRCHRPVVALRRSEGRSCNLRPSERTAKGPRRRPQSDSTPVTRLLAMRLRVPSVSPTQETNGPAANETTTRYDQPP
jgi:hypothetical protein